MERTNSGVITGALAEKSPARMLRAFIDGMSAREDVRVLKKAIGEPAPAELLRAKRGELPDELLDFFAEMNGATFRYALIPDDTPIDGFEIDPLDERSQFREREDISTDAFPDVYLSDFGGPDVLHLLLDNIQNETPVHYIKPREAPPNAATIVYSPEVDRPPHHTVAKSLDEYVRLGISRAFVMGWPLDAAGATIAARLDAAPSAPPTLGPGSRVVSNRPHCIRPNCRATVVQVDRAPRVPDGWKWGDELVLLTFDHGPTCYVSRDSVVPIRKDDFYESALRDPAAFLAGLRDASSAEAALMVARFGVSGYFGHVRPDLIVPDTAPRLFAVLQRAPRPLVADVLIGCLERWLADASFPYGIHALEANGTEYETPRSGAYTLFEIGALVSGALGLWFWWLANEQGVQSMKTAFSRETLARLDALAASMRKPFQVKGKPFQGEGTGGFMAMVAQGGPLPPYPPQGDSWGMVFAAQPRTLFSLHPAGLFPASAFGLESEYNVYWN
jgi:hypothetical protein